MKLIVFKLNCEMIKSKKDEKKKWKSNYENKRINKYKLKIENERIVK